MNEPPKLITPGVMAAKLDQPLGRVLHVLATRPNIKPSARAGTLRLFDGAAVKMVGEELAMMDARRQARGGGK